MKILYLVHQFYPEFQSGTEKFALNIAGMSQKNGHKVKVICYAPQTDTSFISGPGLLLFKEYFFQGLPVLAFKFKTPPIDLHYSLEIKNIEDFKLLLRNENPDLIHVCHPMRVYPLIRAAQEMSIPYVLTLTDSFLLCPRVILAPTPTSVCSGPHGGETCREYCPTIRKEFIQKRLTLGKEILYGAQKIVAPSRFLASVYRQEYPDLSVSVVNHGSKPMQKGGASNQKDKAEIVFGFVGTLAVHKGVHVLIRAFRSLQNERARLRIYGSGQDAYVKHLQELAEGDERIRFMGTFGPEQMQAVYSALDFLVQPSICYESYSFVVAEAQSFEVPVIASKLGALPDKVRDGENGFLFTPGDADKLCARLSEVCENRELISRFKQSLHNDAPIATVEQEAFSYLRSYRQILQKAEEDANKTKTA